MTFRENTARGEALAARGRRPQPLAMITGEMIRAARALLGISPAELCRRAGVSLRTLHTIETAIGVPPVRVQTLQRLVAALEASGIEFQQNAGGVGVRRRRT
jgi:transcriptional regulator with XRE-family HTH domain